MEGTAIGGFLGTLIPALAPAAATVLGGIFGKQMADDLVDQATGSRARAIKAIIKKAQSKVGTGNALVDLEERLNRYKDDALAAINEVSKIKYATYEAVPQDDAEDLVLLKIARLEEEVDSNKIKLKTAEGKERETLRVSTAKAEKSLKKLKNIDELIAQATKNLDEHKERQKDKEEREKKSKETPK